MLKVRDFLILGIFMDLKNFEFILNFYGFILIEKNKIFLLVWAYVAAVMACMC